MHLFYETFVQFVIAFTIGWLATPTLRWCGRALVDRLIARAKRTPYYDLPAYMNRYWLAPYNVVVERTLPPEPGDYAYNLPEANREPWMLYRRTDGTGLVSWRRPFTRLVQMCGIAVRIHEILRSDLGRHPHNHPWWYITIILLGGYWEERYDAAGQLVSTKWHGPGSVLFRRANSWHKLIVPEGQVATTLFITGSKSQTWGFNVEGKKAPYHEYLNKPEKKELS